MLKKLVIVVTILVSLGMGYAAYRVAVPALFLDPQAQAVLDEIRDNLKSVGTLTADVDCISNRPWLDFIDGAMASQGETDFWLDKGTLGEVMWRNDSAYNRYASSHMQPGEASGLRWDDSQEDSFQTWGNSNGIDDVRVALGMAEMIPMGLTLDAATHTINGINCNLLTSSDLRLYVDANQQHRLIRVEVDVLGTGDLAFSTDFLQWQSCAGSEYPNLIMATRYLNDPPYEEHSHWTYVLSNIHGQASLPATVFDLDFAPPIR